MYVSKKNMKLFGLTILLIIVCISMDSATNAYAKKESSKKIMLEKGEQYKIRCNTKKVKYHSSKKSIACVSKKGVVKGLKCGSCTVSVKMKSKVIAKYQIKVVNKNKIKDEVVATVTPDITPTITPTTVPDITPTTVPAKILPGFGTYYISISVESIEIIDDSTVSFCGDNYYYKEEGKYRLLVKYRGNVNEMNIVVGDVIHCGYSTRIKQTQDGVTTIENVHLLGVNRSAVK